MKKLGTVLKAMDDFSDEEMLAFFNATSDFGQWRSRQVGISGTFLGTAFTYFEGIFQPAVHKAFMDLDDMEKDELEADAAEGKTLLEVSEEAAKTSQEKAEVKADAPKDEAPSEKADAPKEEAPSEKADAPKEEAPSEVTPTKKTADVKEPPPVKRTASEAMAAPEGDAKMARVEAPLPEPFTLGA